MENAKKFFDKIAKTEEAKALFAAAGQPETDDECIAAYIEIADKLGVTLTAEEIKAYLELVVEDAFGELDDEELSQLVGGGENAGCESTYQDRENCWWSDGCDRVWNDYNGYLCSGKNYGQSLAEKNRSKIYDQFYHRCDQPSVNVELNKYGLQ